MTDQTSEQQTQGSNEPFPIVGIGSSAGGLEPTSQLLSHLPVDMGMAFVVIQHLAPDHPSLLSELLGRRTEMPVRQIEDGMNIEPNHVYVIAPNTQITLNQQKRFKVEPRDMSPGKFKPIDLFFQSLAEVWDSSAIGIILSGTDADGTLGMRAIRAAGGITMTQCRDTAEFSQMPITAAGDGDVDFVLPPAEIAEELVRMSQHSYVIQPSMAPADEPPPSESDSLATVFRLLRSETGVDFTHYKHNTFNRRLMRRMALYKFENLEDYISYLRTHPDELQALYQDVIITVTSFFRDPDTFIALKNRIFPRILQEKTDDAVIRIWVPGCATGEECYSMAICLLEFLSEQQIKPSIQIFGTDISETAIDKARTGIYNESAMSPVSHERRRRFFLEVESGYQVTQSVRELCVFAKQNLISDPPFSNLDLVSCRNVLIYFTSILQKRVLPIFHYSLRPNGYLTLGGSESVGEASDLFTAVDKKHRIYGRAATPSRLNFDFVSSDQLTVVAKPSGQTIGDPRTGLSMQQKADEIVLNQYAPVGVVINQKLDILQFRGDTSPYLRPASGEPSFNLLKMIRPELLLEVRTAVNQAKRREAPVQKTKLRVDGTSSLENVHLEVVPFKVPNVQEPYLLVLFSQISTPSVEEPPNAIDSSDLDAEPEITRLTQELADVKQELQETQAHLQTTIEDQDSTNQSLTTANEEILSSNEELQSINEELQTAKEEIQAANEELKTTNEELHSRNLEARQVNNDLINLLNNVNIPILMLSSELRIRRFTPAAQQIFNLIPTDVGRPVSDIRLNINVPDLENMLRQVIDTLSMQERELQDTEGGWHLLRVRPYKTTENQIDGAVMTLVDIDALKRTIEQLEVSRNYAESIVETVREPLIVLDADLHIQRANRAFYDVFQVVPAATEQRLIFEIGNGQWDIPELRSLLENVFTNHVELRDYEVEQDFEQIGHKVLLLNARKFAQGDDHRRILLAIEDITDRKQAEAERTRLLLAQQAQAEAEAENIRKNEFLSMLSHELRTPLNSILGWSQILTQRQPRPEVMARALEAISRGARTQAQLIEDLLDISRIIQGRLHLAARPTNLTSIIRSVIESLELTAEQKQIRLEAQLDPTPGSVIVDPDRMQQVFANLLINAIKFTPEGGQVEVRLTYSESEIQAQVIDTGKGISPEILPHIFERFRQDDSSATRSYGGLGLGLAIVRYLVEAHDGIVTAESEGEGQGATFTIALPLVLADVPPARPSALPEADDIRLTGARLLLVDDEEDNLAPLRYVLEAQGATVMTAISAAAALEKLVEQRPDVLISDIAMADMTGIDMIRLVRSRPPEQGGGVPAIALTAYAADSEVQEILAAGFQHHIAKPIDIDEVIALIASLVNS
ncbi:PAS domain-containing protein [Romeria aff. gracilis LEGE 07310]|uniref:PAS domain-containing protein n=1 Tax=Vasconcelosia minhoensis LEGE 07310 TaxID=915328 RepID=A0A8J7ADK4_9CYAN|nr:chemotaxis protein CheB [Romeria gracilis]MBE9077549.1 PAS domain-containing protein [Romeria aff. gracilis LEGE 07310]